MNSASQMDGRLLRPGYLRLQPDRDWSSNQRPHSCRLEYLASGKSRALSVTRPKDPQAEVTTSQPTSTWVLTLPLRGNPSVRKPLMIFGQDESVINHFLLKSKPWVGTKGQRLLLPKTEGLSLMISAIQSCKTGFDIHIGCILDMEEINDVCRRGENNVDVDAAVTVHGQATNKDLKESPFVVSFGLGAHNEGYWTCNHMSVQQFEDCVDCIKVLYPQFNFAFLFDHSQRS